MHKDNAKVEAPIERTFPIEEVTKIAKKESTGFGRRHYRPIYSPFHKWWARRLGCVFRSILLYSLTENDRVAKKLSLFKEDEDNLWPAYFEDIHTDKVVLDPMMGGGTTIVEALRFGNKVIGCDINPVAWFVVKKSVEPIDLEKFKETYENIAESIKDEIASTYKTTCPDCGGQAEAMYYFWVKEIPCSNCKEPVQLFSDYLVASGEKTKKGRERYLYCPKCHEVITTYGWKSKQTCPNCNHVFHPRKDGPAGRGYFTCPSCGQKDNIVDNIREYGKPKEKMYAIEYYCPSCDKNSYKSVDQEDIERYEKAKEKFSNIEDTLSIPSEDIPVGQETHPRLENHGYYKFRDMFNTRQLLNLGLILKEIKNIEDKNIQEYMLLAFSNTLKYNTMFAKYNRSHNFITDIFRTHAYHPSLSPVEANCFDLPKGMGSFRSAVDLIIEGKEWCQKPFDRDHNGNKHFFDTKVATEPALDVDEWDEKNKDCLLLSQSSEYLDLPDKCVDAVITDPPYYGNVMYSELSDFFYVWLRQILKDRYPHFRSSLTPKRGEVVENSVRGNDKEDFIEGLTAVFSESNRLLKDEGLMVFTFHHQETKAWASVLRAVLDAGFYVTAIYPIRAEMAASTHIYAKGNIEYDMIIVCRKRVEVSESRSWRAIEDEIYFRVQEVVEKLEESDKRLSSGDIFAITIGKALEIYSKYYPKVLRDGESVSVEEALSSIPDIVDSQISESRYQQLAKDLDYVTALYLSYIVGRKDPIPYSKLNQEFQQRNLDLNDLIRENLLKREGGELKKVSEIERHKVIEDKTQSNLTYIDRAQYLYYLLENGNLAKEAGKWVDPKTLKVMEILSNNVIGSTKAKQYKELMNYLKNSFLEK